MANDDDVETMQRKTLEAANAYRDALNEMDDRFAKQFEDDGLKAIDAVNAATSALVGLVAVYGTSLEGRRIMDADKFEEMMLNVLRGNMRRLRAQVGNPAQKH